MISQSDATPRINRFIPMPIRAVFPPAVAELSDRNGISAPNIDIPNEIKYVMKIPSVRTLTAAVNFLVGCRIRK